MASQPAIIILGQSGLPLAQKIKLLVDGAIHGPDGVAGCDIAFDHATKHIAALFNEGRTIIGICASAILIRSLGGLLRDKRIEPPVVAVAEDGSAVVPLLGGHHGANALAQKIAEACETRAAITTAGDVRFGISFDDPPPGFTLRNHHDVKFFASRLLAGETVEIDGTAPWLASLPQGGERTLKITVTEKDVEGGPNHLIYHPWTLTVGLGCERGTPSAEMKNLVAAALRTGNWADESVIAYGTIDLKEDEPAIIETALGALTLFTAEELKAAAAGVPNPSADVLAATGTPSVAEAAALALAGSDAELVVPKMKSARATCAIARSANPWMIERGRKAGRLSVVGIGPGTLLMRSRHAADALVSASDWVGYDLYLDLVRDLKTDQTEHRFPLGGEEDRVRHAIKLAKEGKRVALVCSGDAGIYAMASLVYEVIDLEPCRIKVDVIPGISAFQAAAAKAGAVIGHDFCCISLSDLLTPWEIIEKRVKAAAEGDFVVSFYNPRSLKRRDQLERAFAMLAPQRPPDTPVVIASNLGRPEENVKIVRFADFNPDEVDMLTLVMVGSSQSKSFVRGDGRTYAYTPRGYAKKREAT